MAVKYSVQALFIYGAMSVYLLSLTLSLLRRWRAGHFTYFAGFLIALAGYLYRWQHVGHIPLQNLFELFLGLGMIYPVSYFSRKVLYVPGEAVDALLGVIILFPAGFIFSAQPQNLPPALQSPLFIPHVMVYMIAYIFMAKAAVQAVCERLAPGDADDGSIATDKKPSFLTRSALEYEQATYRMIATGFIFLTLGLILGSWWGQLAWADYWGWDPKELWSLASWLVYVGYFHFRFAYQQRYRAANSFIALLGIVVIVVTLLWVNLARIFVSVHTYSN
ncbi:MAG: cytochrome c biogenesis protein CcsA [Sedimentisphaerales bacterium]|nr:cytochrome c biogenesis protein CcsA [Sedimentisphaerales bacterium]